MSKFPEVPDDRGPEASEVVPIADIGEEAVATGAYDAVTCDEGEEADLPDGLPADVARQESEDKPALFQPRRDTFGRLTEDQLDAVHPYALTEDLATRDIGFFYASHSQPVGAHQAWNAIEQANCRDGNPDLLQTAKEYAAQATDLHRPVNPDAGLHDRFATDSDAAQWFDAAMVGAHIDAFRDRLEQGQITAATAEELYRKLAEEILPNAVSEGDAGEAIVSAIGARAVLLDGPGEFMWPSSPREGMSSLHTAEGKVLNHDHYRLEDDAKVPLEVKIRSGASRASRYDGNITRINCMSTFGQAILGIDLSDKKTARPTLGRLISPFIVKTQRLMQFEIREGVQRPELDLATRALRQKIEADRTDKQTPERFRSDTLPQRRR